MTMMTVREAHSLSLVMFRQSGLNWSVTSVGDLQFHQGASRIEFHTALPGEVELSLQCHCAMTRQRWIYPCTIACNDLSTLTPSTQTCRNVTPLSSSTVLGLWKWESNSCRTLQEKNACAFLRTLCCKSLTHPPSVYIASIAFLPLGASSVPASVCATSILAAPSYAASAASTFPGTCQRFLQCPSATTNNQLVWACWVWYRLLDMAKVYLRNVWSHALWTQRRNTN
jgi:hypothetical protein